jgi:hypothetical protein
LIGYSTTGSFDNTERFLDTIVNGDIFATLERFGAEGVSALSASTPVDSGETANSWTYEVVRERGSWSIIWGNTHVVDGRPIAILLQYGHGTGTGGFVQGRDYINPAMRPIFDRMADEAWKAVTSA